MKKYNPFKIILEIENGLVQSSSRGIIKSLGIVVLYILLLVIYQMLTLLADIPNEAIKFIYTLIMSMLFYGCILALFKKEFCYEDTENVHEKITIKMGIYTVILGIGYALFACIIAFFINKFINTSNLTKEMGSITSSISLAIIYVCIIGPFCEEFVMRGIVLGGLLKKYSPKVSILISAVLFALMHMNEAQFFTAFIMGLLLGAVYVKYKSLILCMIIHCVNNSIPTISSYLPANINYSKLAQSNFKISLIFSLIGIIVIAIMIIFLNKENNKRGELQQLNIR